ncbi:hypothetical protein XA26_19710 [Mycolicibacterium fortuitum]|uniref:Uncharacterized protein n=1 Tax=Mycolicibacterium fortuitum TaxID=1766 RepID=A0A0N9Y7R5_MYCFO|nr:hypothetical protein XA26_19710 [Mycolicibacterium fortuitum]
MNRAEPTWSEGHLEDHFGIKQRIDRPEVSSAFGEKQPPDQIDRVILRSCKHSLLQPIPL